MKTFIIAEIGINHNGDLEIAKQLIDVTKDCGCDAVKFQKRTIDIVYDKDFLKEPRKSPWGTTQREQKEGIELTEDDYREINIYCNKKNMAWFASAWDIESQKLLRQFHCQYNKVASAMLVYEDLLKEIASEQKYTFISTGMSTLQEIEKAVNIFDDNNCPFELLHCISTYPMKDEDANLSCIETLRNAFACKVGYSGHESGIVISLAAVAIGATSLERHITLERTMYGSDQAASIEPNGLKQLVTGVRKIEKAIGDGIVNIIESEKPVAKSLRAYIK